MQNDNRAIYFVLTIFALFIIAGFFFVFDSIGNLRSDIKDLEMSKAYAPQETVSPSTQTNTNTPGEQTGNVPTPEPAPTSTNTVSGSASQGNVIPSAIIFQTKSSPTLLPQVDVTITVQNVSRASDGTLAVNFKAYTSNATGYSAIDPSTLFQVISLNGGYTSPTSVNGSFSSMPPKSVVTGSVTLPTDPSKSSVIIQIGPNDAAHFYTFDFDTKTYKETPIG